jgi:hypothetical protein
MRAPGEEAEAPQMAARKQRIQGLSKSSLTERHWRGGLHARPAHQQDRNMTMAKMLVIYKTPADPEAFDRHYFEIHVPLAKKLPGLRRYDISRRPIIKRSAGRDAVSGGDAVFRQPRRYAERICYRNRHRLRR